MRILAIGMNTFKEAVRNKIYYLLIVFGIVFILSSKIVGLLSIGDEIRVIKDVGLAVIHFFSVLIAIFTGINLVYKEIEKKTIFNVLSKPVRRSEFIIGKFLGLSLTILMAVCAMMVIFFCFLWFFTGQLDFRLTIYFMLLYFELLIITSISLLFSSFSTPILSSVFTICLFLIGHIIWTFNLFKEKLIEPFASYVTHVIYYLLPNLAKFNIKNEVVLNMKIETGPLMGAILYAILYICATLLLSILIFKKREFK